MKKCLMVGIVVLMLGLMSGCGCGTQWRDCANERCGLQTAGAGDYCSGCTCTTPGCTNRATGFHCRECRDRLRPSP